MLDSFARRFVVQEALQRRVRMESTICARSMLPTRAGGAGSRESGDDLALAHRVAKADVPRVAGCARSRPGAVARQIFLVDADVEAGLLKLLFDIDLALLDKRQQIAAQPRDLGEREAMLGDVDSLAGEMRRSGIAFGRSCVAVDVHQMLLEFDGANSGVDLQRRVEVGVVGAGQVARNCAVQGRQ